MTLKNKNTLAVNNHELPVNYHNDLAFNMSLLELRTEVQRPGLRSFYVTDRFDYAFRHRTITALNSNAAQREIEALSEIISQATHPIRIAFWSVDQFGHKSYPIRWDGFRALLDTRLEQIASLK